MQLPPVIKQAIERFQRSKLGAFIRIYSEREVGVWATVVAYSIMFAIFPIILAMLAIIGLVLRDPDVFDSVLQRVLVVIPADAVEPVVGAVTATRQAAGAFGVISFLGLIWAGSSLFGALAHGFNQIYQVPDRNLVWQRLMGAAMIFVFALFLVLSLAASSLASFATDLARELPAIGQTVGGPLSAVLSLVVALGLALAFFTLVYWLMPNRRLPVRHVLPGAALSAGGFLALAQAFPLYGRYFVNFNQYGAVFGLFFLMMTWFFLLAQLIFAGAVLNLVLQPQAVAAAPKEQPKHQEELRSAA